MEKKIREDKAKRIAREKANKEKRKVKAKEKKEKAKNRPVAANQHRIDVLQKKIEKPPALPLPLLEKPKPKPMRLR